MKKTRSIRSNFADSNFSIRIGAITFLLLGITQCSPSNFYAMRAQFLKPVNYPGSLCRVSSETQNKLLTPRIVATDVIFARKISRPHFLVSCSYGFSWPNCGSGKSKPPKLIY